jgi:hypothetical protein
MWKKKAFSGTGTKEIERAERKCSEEMAGNTIVRLKYFNVLHHQIWRTLLRRPRFSQRRLQDRRVFGGLSFTETWMKFLFSFLESGETVHQVRRPLTGLLYQPRMIDDERGAVDGMRVGRGNRSTRSKPTHSATLFTTNPTRPDLGSNQATTVGSRRLITSAVRHSLYSYVKVVYFRMYSRRQNIRCDRMFFFFLNLCGGTLVTADTTGLLYQPRTIGDGDCDCGEIGGM